MTLWTPSARAAHHHAQRQSSNGESTWVVLRRYDIFAALPAQATGGLHTMHAEELARYERGELCEPTDVVE